MTHTRIGIVCCCLLLSLLMLPLISNAEVIHVVINGTAVNCSDGATECNIAGTSENVEVTGYNGVAKVVITEGNLPVIKLINAKFRALGGATNGSLTFWRSFSTGRTGPRW